MVLRYGGNANISTKKGSIFHIALKLDNDVVMNYILDNIRDFDYSIKDETGENVLQKLTDSHNVNIAIKLLETLKANREKEETRKKEEGQRVNLGTLFGKLKNGNYVLHECVLKNNQRLLENLLKDKEIFGIDPEVKNKAGFTFLELQAF